MAQCDVCNVDITWEEATVYTPDEFRRLVSMGFQPSEGMIQIAAGYGVSREQAIAQWKQGLVAQSTTDWVLCSACAGAAARWLPKPKGTGLVTPKTWEPVTPEMLKPVEVPSRSPATGATQAHSPSRKWWQFWRK
jgi:hypothetical protein